MATITLRGATKQPALLGLMNEDQPTPAGLSPALVQAAKSAGGMTLARAAHLPQPRATIGTPGKKTIGGRFMSAIAPIAEDIDLMTGRPSAQPVVNPGTGIIMPAAASNAMNPSSVAIPAKITQPAPVAQTIAGAAQAAAPAMVGPPTLGQTGVQNQYVIDPKSGQPVPASAGTGALVSTPSANRAFTPEDITRIMDDPNAGRLQPPPAAPATIAEAMRNTGGNRFVLDAQGKSMDPNDIARKEFNERGGIARGASLAMNRAAVSGPRLAGKTGETIRLADEGQQIQGNVAMAGMVSKSADRQADRQSKETIASGQDKARVDAAKASASRPQDSAARAQMVKANAEAVAAAQAELDAAKADVGAWNSAADKKRVADAEQRLAEAIARQERESRMAGDATTSKPLAENLAEEGDEVVGPDGKMYVIRNGVPVPV